MGGGSDPTRDRTQAAGAARSFRRHRRLLLAACVAVVLCAILGPTVGVIGPGMFGRGTTLGLVVLTIVLAGAAGLAVLCAWGFSVGGRPWRANPGGVTAGTIVQAVVGGLALVALALLGAWWTLWSFGVRAA